MWDRVPALLVRVLSLAPKLNKPSPCSPTPHPNPGLSEEGILASGICGAEDESCWVHQHPRSVFCS